ncbi:winged helix-turn-helix transcriptional regulator [Nordella sp. HKS 07]|uniref:MarR family winged helix-turn-helix transcriptional regulator n=1 Tax=Nordella sp. HKS 07 TaxID=2712222 RepID=UPI0013E12101|nr:MarR family winged helix-turn-helix transcriptional regulator [Nordella sp. HKS 07]QIG48670.1 winged helix-turn-helix transcriptional regulator [Nordella sp. HKS 07]
MVKTEAESREIAYALERLSRLMRGGEFGEGLNPAQWEALRFLARANRFSNSPGALTRYLGATKGTISQTVKALERKKLIVKSERPGEKRSIVLELTEAGHAMMAKDPWMALAAACGELGGKTRRRMDKGLAELLAGETARRQSPSFGACDSCRFWREQGRGDDALGPHLCMLFDLPISTTEVAQICIAHEPAN